MYALSSEQMKNLDLFAINSLNIPAVLLMEHAAISLYKEIEKDFSRDSQILIVAGSGNNGGDGLALARLLLRNDYRVKIYILEEEEALSDLSKLHYIVLKNLQAEIKHINNSNDLEEKNWDVIVDAIFGISLSRDVEGKYADTINYINSNVSYTISVDVPSGIDATTGEFRGCAVRADKTITFDSPKLGLYFAFDYVGEIVVADITIPKNTVKMSVADEKELVEIISKETIKELYFRKKNTHKGNYGTALIIAGSFDMVGTAMLTAKSAYKAGAGIVNVLTNSNNKKAINVYVPEAICYGYDDGQSYDELKNIFDRLADKSTAILIGPGISTSETAKNLVKLAIRSDKPLVIDADGLNVIAKDDAMKEELKARRANTIITPHIAEMARLIKIDNNEVVKRQVDIAKTYSKECKLTIVLKSARTVVATKDGCTYLNIKGNNGMATGGSGDVLAGMLVGLLAKEGASAKLSSLGAVYLHALAGDKAAKKLGKHSLMARDLIDEISFL